MMQIKVRCSCGNKLQVDQELAGAMIRCPECKEVIGVPELALTTPEDPPRSAKNLSFAAGFGIAMLALSIPVLAAWMYLREPEPAMGGAQITQALTNNSKSNATVVIERSETYSPPKIVQPPEALKQPEPLKNQEGLLVHRLPSIAWSSAYDPESGHIAVTDDLKGIVIYSIDDLVQNKRDPIASIQVEGKPTSVCLKPYDGNLWFACVSSESSELTLIDTTTLQIVRQVPLALGTRIGFLASSSACCDPYLYFIRSRENGNATETRFGRLDLRNETLQELSGCKFLDCQVSSDGKTIYAKTHATGTTKFEYAYGNWEDFRKRHFDTRRTVHMKTQSGASVRLIGKKIAIESTYLEPSFGGRSELAMREVSLAEFEPLARSQTLPLILGMSDSGFALGSSITGKTFVKFQAPEPVQRFKREIKPAIKSDFRNRKRYGTRLGHANVDGYLDDQRKVALAIIDDYLMLMNLQELNLPKSHPLDSTIEFPSVASIDEPMELDIPKGAAGSKVAFAFKSLTKLQDGASQKSIELPRQTDDKICWTPDRSLIGKQDILVTATLGDDQRNWIWPIEIGYRPTEESFDFYVQGISGSPQSKLAVVWGIAHEDVAIRYPQNNRSSQWADQSILAIYDIESREIRNRIEVPYEIISAKLHSTGVYAVSGNANSRTPIGTQLPGRLLRFDAASLKPLGAMHLNLTNPSVDGLPSFELELQGADEIFVFAKRMQIDPQGEISLGSDYRISLPDLTLLETTKQKKLRYIGLDASSPIQEGVLWDESLTSPKLLLDPGKILDSFGRNMIENMPSVTLEWPSKRVLTGTYIPSANVQARSTNRGIYIYPPEQNPTIKPVEFLTLIPFPQKEPPQVNQVQPLQYDDLIISKEIEALCGPFLFATSAGRVFRIQTRSLPTSPKVFSLIAQQDHFVIQAGEKMRWNYSAPGATRYSLEVYLNIRRIESEGLEFDDTALQKVIELESKDGSFEFEIGKELVTHAVKSYLKAYFTDPTFGLVEVIGLIDKMEKPYRRLTGRTPSTLPAVATLVITAEDGNGKQKTKLSHCSLVEVPLEELLPEIDDLRASYQSKRHSAR